LRAPRTGCVRGSLALTGALELAGALAVLVALLGIGFVYFRRREAEPDESAGAAVQEPPEPAAPTDSAGDDPLALGELATDEDRVLTLLESEGGRMRQAEIADRLDWSPSKTSRVMAEMADAGDIERLRIGRENVIDLADDEDGK